jgi:hypothetical protein
MTALFPSLVPLPRRGQWCPNKDPVYTMSCMASLSWLMPDQQLFVDCNDLSDSLEGGCHAALLFSLRCAIREYKGCILATNS